MAIEPFQQKNQYRIYKISLLFPATWIFLMNYVKWKEYLHKILDCEVKAWKVLEMK